ncbi:MAG: ATPase domain-containing protein, partial [Candidatus Cloacimonadaceae bacterium]
MLDKNKESALKTAITQLEKKFGAGTIMRLGDKPDIAVQVIPTGAFNLDIALGIGGIPKGRITEIYGAEASGKTTLALHIAAEAQKQEGVVAFIDAEHALDVSYAKRLGVQTDDLMLSQPDGGEQALEVVETLVRSSAVDLVIVDSVAALVPKQEIEGEMGDSHVGLQARLMS